MSQPYYSQVSHVVTSKAGGKHWRRATHTSTGSTSSCRSCGTPQGCPPQSPDRSRAWWGRSWAEVASCCLSLPVKGEKHKKHTCITQRGSTRFRPSTCCPQQLTTAVGCRGRAPALQLLLLALQLGCFLLQLLLLFRQFGLTSSCQRLREAMWSCWGRLCPRQTAKLHTAAEVVHLYILLAFGKPSIWSLLCGFFKSSTS